MLKKNVHFASFKQKPLFFYKKYQYDEKIKKMKGYR
jgi:hypothetical protein